MSKCKVIFIQNFIWEEEEKILSQIVFETSTRLVKLSNGVLLSSDI